MSHDFVLPNVRFSPSIPGRILARLFRLDTNGDWIFIATNSRDAGWSLAFKLPRLSVARPGTIVLPRVHREYAAHLAVRLTGAASLHVRHDRDASFVLDVDLPACAWLHGGAHRACAPRAAPFLEAGLDSPKLHG
jgi:hypothetical protein